MLRRAVAGEHDADRGVHLVDRAEGGDARVELRDAGAVAERGLPRVAAARVDLRQPDGLVSLARHARTLERVIRRARTMPTPTRSAEVFLRRLRGLMTYLPRIHTDAGPPGGSARRWSERYEVWVAEEDGGVVGFAARSARGGSSTSTSHPDAQNRGIGTALLEHAKRRAARRVRALGLPAERRRAALLRAPRLASSRALTEPETWRRSRTRATSGVPRTERRAPRGAGGRGSSAR